ncbi:MAG: histone H1 [Bacteroidetes bacterium QS_3_64_15]|nr:MAG: histone H1 [Bacteroidetes bacterium QS_3_64_15]
MSTFDQHYSFDERYGRLTDILEDAEEDLMKFYEKGNKAAGTRARKKLMELKKQSHDIRQEIQKIKNNEL